MPLPRRLEPVMTPCRLSTCFKASGIGRENGIDAVNEYLEEKSVFGELTGGTRDPFELG